MKRRAFIAGIGSAAAWPALTRAQQALPLSCFASVALSLPADRHKQRDW
jgi:hypothetical protein